MVDYPLSSPACVPNTRPGRDIGPVSARAWLTMPTSGTKVTGPVGPGGIRLRLRTQLPGRAYLVTSPAATRRFTHTSDELALIDRYWRAANYLSVGQIYLLDNPLLREPLLAGARQAAPARPLGHHAGPELPLRPPEPGDPAARPGRASTSPAPATAAPAWWPTPTSRAPTARSTRTSARTRRGCARLFRQFSFPGGIPSHVAPETPGLDPRGRRARLRAGARLRRRVRQPRPGRRRASSATARPRPGRWRRAGTRNKFLNPVRDGAVLPVLHLNGYKIANPTVLARIPEDELRVADARLRLRAVLRRRRRPRRRCTERWPATLDTVLDEIAAIQREARDAARAPTARARRAGR